MTTQDDDPTQDAPPGWVLRTPTRRREVWALPALLLVLAGVVVSIAVAFGDRLTTCAGIVAAVVVVTGAAAMFAAARRAYSDQTRCASWDLHRTRVLVGVVTGAVLLVASLLVGRLIGFAIGSASVLLNVLWLTRSVTRFERLAVAWACSIVAAACVVLVAVGLLLDGVPERLVAFWVGPAGLVAVITAVIAVVQFRSAAGSRDQPE